MYCITRFSRIQIGHQFYAEGVWWFKYSSISGWCRERQVAKDEESTRKFKDSEFVGIRPNMLKTDKYA